MKNSDSTYKKALIIRFSSFGDIVQSSFVAESLTDYKTDLLTKSEFANAFTNFNIFNEIISFNKKEHSLFKIAQRISNSGYDIIYDAHNNQRTLLLKFFLLLLNPNNFFKFKTRSKFRIKRFFLFKLKINLFPEPFKGAESFLEPLDLKLQNNNKLNSQIKPRNNTVLMAPSAAWDLKKWPAEYWAELSNNLKKQNSDLDIKFIGGPDDHFINDIQKNASHSENLAGKLSWTETIEEIKQARLLISGDTGVLHIADFFGINAIGLMGPSAFGFPSRNSSRVLSLNLNCQPCSKDGRGKCRIEETQKCLRAIKPNLVLKEAMKDI